MSETVQAQLRELLKAHGERAVASELGLGIWAVLRAAAGVRVQRATSALIETKVEDARFRLEGGA